jgi:hypothetical protein
VGDDDRLFISGAAIVIIIEDNRPICRRFDFSLMRVRVQLPQPQMAEDAFLRLRSGQVYDVVFDEAADFHLLLEYQP